MGTWRDFDDLRKRLGGVAHDESGGDNLAILLASYFEPGIEDDELDDSGTWKQGALDKADAVLAAIHAHYAPALATERARADALASELATLQASYDAILATDAELIDRLTKMGEKVTQPCA